ncbi:MAG: hypothetical protein JOZ32_17020 [Bryobacterales bacterium]|nr:hypothetical protein [Bryobacterales bacterium]
MRKTSVVRLSAAVFACGAMFTAYTHFGNQAAKLNTIKLKNDLYHFGRSHTNGSQLAARVREMDRATKSKTELSKKLSK